MAETKQLFCRFCGAALPEDSLFCEQCGKPVALVETDLAPGTVEAPAEPVVEEAPVEAVAEVAPAEPVVEEAPAEVISEEPAAEAVQADDAFEPMAPTFGAPAETPAEPEAPAETPAEPEAPAEPVVPETPAEPVVTEEQAAPITEAAAAASTIAFGSNEGFTQAPDTGFTAAPTPAQPAQPEPTPVQPAPGNAFEQSGAAGGYQQAPQQNPAFTDQPTGQTHPYMTNVSTTGDAAFSAQVAPKQKKSKKKFIIPAVILVLLLLLAAGVGGVMNSATEVDIESYITVEFHGTDGNGSAVAVLDEDSLESKLRNEGCTEEQALDIIDGVYLDPIPSTLLSNGDEVTVYVSYDEEEAREAGIVITTDSFTKTVADLPEAGNENAALIGTWEGVSYSYEGVTMTPDEADLHFSVTFNENGRVDAITNGEDDGAGTWVFDGSKVTITSGTDVHTGTLNSNGQLELTMEGVTITLEKK